MLTTHEIQRMTAGRFTASSVAEIREITATAVAGAIMVQKGKHDPNMHIQMGILRLKHILK